jgi:hypothetical protein
LRDRSPARIPPIRVTAAPPGRALGMHIAIAVRDAMAPLQEPAS